MSPAERPGCLDDDAVSAYAEKRLGPEEAEAVRAHLATCDACGKVVVAVLDAMTTQEERPIIPPPPRKRSGLAPGTRVGRYEVKRRLGAGGMGVVYEAEDPELKRNVALKVLRAAGGDEEERESSRLRLMREAQAMAKLSHPNVVPVFDVGTFEGKIFVAMELIASGTTLRDWAQAGPRTAGESLAMVCAAGRGLAAAHAAGLVHRDFKPDNVLVSADGVVKVTDFGLARSAALSGEQAAASSPEESVDGPLATPLTRRGIVVGTPVYMAPEQFVDSAVDALADQFAFCVVVWELLFGERPFTADQLRDGPLQLPEPPQGPGLPRRALAAVRRGLSADRAERFPSMDALLRELEPLSRRSRVGAVATAAAVALIALPFAYREATAPAPCTGAEARFAETWSAERAGKLRQAFTSASADRGAPVFETVKAELDDYGRSWSGLAAAACEAHLRGERSSAALDLQMACLDRRRRAVDALVSLLERADAQAVGAAAEAVQRLRNPEGCANVEALAAPVPPPESEEVRRAVETLRERLVHAQALHDAGRYAQALEVVTAAMQDQQALSYPPAAAEAHNLLGWVKQRLGDARGAQQARFDAILSAMSGRHDEVGVMAATELVFTFAWGEAQFESAHYWARYAQALLDRVGGGAELEGKLASNRGVLAFSEGRYADAVNEYQAALALREKVFGPKHLHTANVLVNLALAHERQGAPGDAAPLYVRALEIHERLLGPDHPQLADTLVNYAYTLQKQQRAPEASALLERALAIRERALGPNHPATWQLHLDLGLAAEARREWDRASTHHQTALRLAEAAGGEGGAAAIAHAALASLAERRGGHRRALESFRKAHQLRVAAHGPSDSDALLYAEDLGRLLVRSGRAAEALSHLEQTLALEQRVLGEEHPGLATCLVALARAKLELGMGREARADLERALKLVEDQQWSPVQLAPARFLLARALPAGPEALDLATQARDALREDPLTPAGDLAEVETWLSASVTARAE